MNAPSDLLVTCLCARWCGTCREYEPVFAAAARAVRTTLAATRWTWLDIEDDDEALGDIDVDDFPTLLIARGSEVLFFGPVLPHLQTLNRLVERAGSGALLPLADAELGALARRAVALVPLA